MCCCCQAWSALSILGSTGLCTTTFGEQDIAHKKGIYARRGRACAANIVPSSTGAASAIGLVIPSLKISDLGLFDGDNFEFMDVIKN